MHKLTVGVLRGGPSNEYDISLKTGGAVLEALDRNRYEPVDLFVSKRGEWHASGFRKEPADALHRIDVVINAMHGEYGEDGTVQRVLDHVGVPYTGSGAFASALAMHKPLTKKALAPHGIRMARHATLSVSPTLEEDVVDLFRTFPQPSVLKPAAAGSSVGVTIARNFHDFADGVTTAFAYSPTVMVEEFIKGKEATCGVVDDFRGEEHYALLPIEILPSEKCGFYNYEAKYRSEDTRLVCPGNFSADEKQKLQNIAKRVHTVLGLRHYSRSDFIVAPRGVYFLEVNTLPGMTSHSLVPKALQAIGTKFSDFLDHLIGLARRRR